MDPNPAENIRLKAQVIQSKDRYNSTKKLAKFRLYMEVVE